ncbi:unnamed protein product [Adineta steineri]|uniref:PH domain-containing protein n=2 Tax=Adineta steineri TaxID=433720 RepID=A0A818X0T1_9BILA|nr:unnamed protein product [Adineta steineri]
MLNFNWNTVDESTFQGYLNKYANAFKGYQTRYCVVDTQTKSLLYFTPDEVRKKGPRGVIELIDCWVSPSNEDDVTFTVQTVSGESFKLRAMNARGRQKWIDKLRACSGSNAANVYVSSLPIPKTQQTNVSPLTNSPNEPNIHITNRKTSKMDHHEQTIKELKEVMRCVEVNQREFVETIDVIPDDITLHSLSKEMLLLRSISQSCINSLQDSLIILTRRRTPENEPASTSIPSPTNTYNKQMNQSLNSSTGARPSLTVGLSSQSNTSPLQNKNSNLISHNQQRTQEMPGKITEKENRLSLISIEVLISHVRIDLNIECHLPCMVFRLLDYPAVSIPYFDEWQIEEFHNLKKEYPHITWRQLLSDQFYELRSANGKFSFKRGKSCLFKTYFRTLYTHLLNVPLFLLLIDQINNSDAANTSHFIGSCNVKLNELIEILNQSIIKNGNDIPLVEQQTFHCTLFNLMGNKIGTCDVAIRFCHYGTTILTQLPMLNDQQVIKQDNQEKMVESFAPPPASTVIKERITESSVPVLPTDTVVKHIHFVNEKKDIGLQLSRSDLPSSSNNNKSAQTRWTSTRTRSTNYHQSTSHYLRTIEDPSLDDPTVTFYQPPPLYFNSDSDFLQMMTPSTKVITEAKENRLFYLASIPIASFNDGDDDDKPHIENENINKKQQIKIKSTNNVQFDLPSSISSTINSQTQIISKQQTLAKDFLHNFPLLRSLVQEALALQQSQHIILSERPHTAIEQRQKNVKQKSIRPASATNIRSKSVIIPRNINNTRRLRPPPPPKTNHMIVTKSDVRNLVDRLHKPKMNKKIEQKNSLIDQNIPTEQPTPLVSPRRSLKPITTSSPSTVQKPPPSYNTTRAHRLMAEFSRARRGGFQPQITSSPKSQISPKKEPISKIRIPPSTPQNINTGTISHLSLLNKVEIDTASIGKNTTEISSIEKTPENIGRTMKSPTTITTSQEVSLKLNQTSIKTAASDDSDLSISQRKQENGERKDDLAFSISDITDYFTDGGESSTHPLTRQST